MAIYVKKGTTAPIDISRFVIDMSNIPVTTRNRDYSLVAEPIEITFTSEIENEAASTSSFAVYDDYTNAAGAGQVIQVFNEETYIYTGYIDSIEQNYGTGTFTIKTVHPFQRMKYYYWYPNDMDAYLDAYKISFNILDHTNPANKLHVEDLIPINGLFAACCLRAGLNFDSSSCDTFPEYRRTANGLEWDEYSFVFRDMQYAINQTYVSAGSNYGTVAAIQNRLTLWDVFSFYSQVFRMNYTFNGYKTIKGFKNVLGKDTVQDLYSNYSGVSGSKILEYDFENIFKYSPGTTAVAFNYYLGTTGSYTDPFDYIGYYQSPYIWDAKNNTNITTDAKYDDYRQSEFLSNVVFLMVTSFENPSSSLDNAYTWWAGGGTKSVRNDANETLIRDNNVYAKEEMKIIGLDLTNIKPVENVYLIPNNYSSGSEVCEITQYYIDITAD